MQEHELIQIVRANNITSLVEMLASIAQYAPEERQRLLNAALIAAILPNPNSGLVDIIIASIEELSADMRLTILEAAQARLNSALQTNDNRFDIQQQDAFVGINRLLNYTIREAKQEIGGVTPLLRTWVEKTTNPPAEDNISLLNR